VKLHCICIGKDNGKRRLYFVTCVCDKLLLLFNASCNRGDSFSGKKNYEQQHHKPAEYSCTDRYKQYGKEGAYLHTVVKQDDNLSFCTLSFAYPVLKAAVCACSRSVIFKCFGNSGRFVLGKRGYMSYIRPYDIAVFVDRNCGIACRIHCVFIVSAKAVVLFIVGRFSAVVLRRKIGIILTAGCVGCICVPLC